MGEIERQYLENIFKQGSLQVIGADIPSVNEFVDFVMSSNNSVNLVHQITGRGYKSVRIAKVIKVAISDTGLYARHFSTRYLPLNTVIYIANAEKFDQESYAILKGTLSSSATIQTLVVLFTHTREDITDVSDMVETFNDLYSSNLVPATATIAPKALIHNKEGSCLDGPILLSILEDLITDSELRISVSV